MEDSENYYKEWLSYDVLRPEPWINSSRSLILTLNTLKPHLIDEWRSFRFNNGVVPGMHYIYLMLSGFAIENILKSIIVRNFQNVVNLENLPEEIKSHDLNLLCARAGIKLQEEESDLLKRIGDFAIWIGRYPAPVSYKNLIPIVREDEREYFRVSVHETDIRNIECILKYFAYKSRDIDLQMSIDMSVSSHKLNDWEIGAESELTTIFIPKSPSD